MASECSRGDSVTSPMRRLRRQELRPLPRSMESPDACATDCSFPPAKPLPDAAAFRAGRMMLDEMRAFAKKRVPFAFETTLSGRGYLSFIRRCKAEGYKIHLFFLSLRSVDLAVSRIRERALRGGHDVPEQIVRRRFDRSARNFLARNRELADV